MSVEFEISREYSYSRCRACGHRILYFSIERDRFFAMKPFVQFHLNPGEKHKAYCPFCGEKELWAEEFALREEE